LEVELTPLSGQSAAIAANEAPRWSLVPSGSRVDDIDQGLRVRVAEALDYLAKLTSLDPSRQAALVSLERRLKAAPVSPWVFCLYSKLVAELSKDPRGDVTGIFADIVLAASLPADQGVVDFCDPVVSESWWNHFRLLLDTDRQRPFKPQAPSTAAFALCKQDIELGFAVMQQADPILHDEVRSLLHMIVLGSPASADCADVFNGASTFFLWGAVLLNANLRRSAISIVDLLVHESSHVLLFGLAADDPLTQNSGHKRYASPVRSDKRPIDGIFHACFVSTRVHLAMGRLLGSGLLGEEDSKIAVKHWEYNGTAARASLEVLAPHAKTTELGEKILGTLRAYWTDIAAD
jgi:hypothetical protein